MSTIESIMVIGLGQILWGLGMLILIWQIYLLVKKLRRIAVITKFSGVNGFFVKRLDDDKYVSKQGFTSNLALAQNFQTIDLAYESTNLLGFKEVLIDYLSHLNTSK